MKRDVIEIHGAGGRRVEREVLHRSGVWVVHEAWDVHDAARLGAEDDNYTVTHEPSGLRLLGTETLEWAKHACDAFGAEFGAFARRAAKVRCGSERRSSRWRGYGLVIAAAKRVQDSIRETERGELAVKEAP